MNRRRNVLSKYRQKKQTAQNKSAARDPAKRAEMERQQAEDIRMRDRIAREVQRLERRSCPHCKQDTLAVVVDYPYDFEMDVMIVCENDKCRTRWERGFRRTDFTGNPTWIPRSCWQGFMDTKNWFAKEVARVLMEEPNARQAF